MYSINNSSIASQKKKILIKKNDLNFIGFPKIHFPFLQRKESNFNNFKDAKLIKKYHEKFAKIKNNSSNMKNNEKILRLKVGPGNHIYNLIRKNRNTADNVLTNPKNNYLDNFNSISNYNSLLKAWNEFNISESYKSFFNLILNKLSKEEKEDICLKELKELSELKNNISSLLKEIQARKKSLEKLFKFNNLLSRDLITEINAPNNTIMKEISEQIANLRLHSVNICFKMKKIKNRIYEGYIYGKFDLNFISKQFGFDKDYLIKMKEEMNFLKGGKIKMYFNIGLNPDPFLMKASDNIILSNNESSFYMIPMSKELEDSIKQCNYFIYQELIYYQSNNNRINSFINSQMENIDKNINYNEIYNEDIYEEGNNYENILDNSKFKEDKINKIDNNHEFNNHKHSSDKLEKSNSMIKEKEESILFEENRINMNDILNEKINNQINVNKQKLNLKNSEKKTDKLSESQVSRISYLTSNATKRGKLLNSYSNKNLKVVLFEGYIHYFEDNFFNEYYSKIPEQEIKMFNLKNKLIPNMINGIAPFILLIKEDNYNINIFNKQIKEKENIYGCCAFNFTKQNNKLKIRISHISAIVDYNYSDYKDNLKIIYNNIINSIIKEFCFDEIIIEISKNNLNQEINDIFKEIGFFEKTISISKNQIKSNGGEEISNNGQIKLNFLIYKNKNELDDSSKNSISSFYGNNLFYFFNSILLCNSDKEFDINKYNEINMIPEDIQQINNLKYKDSEIYINLSAINSLFQSNNNNIFSKLFKRITSLDKLMKIFLLNKIDKNEIPLSAAENRFNVIGFVLDKLINNILFNSSKLANNYNLFNSDSFLDEVSGIYYNFMRPCLLYEISEESIQINCYIIINEPLAIAFIKFENNLIYEEILNKKNLYNQVNDIFKELISNKKLNILKNKTIWIPCFHSYRHLKCLINNSSFTVHEFTQISNKIINTHQRRKKEKAYEFLFNNNLNSFLLEPQINSDIIIDNNFIIGIFNNAEFFNKISMNKNNISPLKKERLTSGFSSENKEDIINLNEEKPEINTEDKDNDEEIKMNYGDFPNILFLNYIKKSDFIKA